LSIVTHTTPARRRWPAPALLALVFALSLPAVTPRIYAADEVEYFAFLRSLWFDHDVSFENEYRHFYDSGATHTPLFFDTFLGPDSMTATGRHVTFATIGSALLWAPFYAVADAGVRVARLAGATVAADGYSRPYVAAVAYGSAVYGFLALLLAMHASRLIVYGGRGPRRTAHDGEGVESRTPRGRMNPSVSATVAVWLGTPLLFYMYVAPPFSHATSAFAVAAFVVAWLHVRRRWSPAGAALLGVLAALMAMVREQDVLVAAGAGLDFAWELIGSTRPKAESPQPKAVQGRWHEAGRLLVSGGVGCVAAVVAYLPQACTYLALNGRLGPSKLVTRKMTWTSPHAGQVLFSPEHGFLFWTPLAALAVGGLVWLACTRTGGGGNPAQGPPSTNDVRRIALCLLVMVALQVYVAGAVESWTVAGAFGQRRFVGLTLMLVTGLTALFSLAGSRASRTKLVSAVIVLATWWNLALMVQFGTGMMDRQRLALGTNAWNAFVAVPRDLPRIAYRYAFDRKSFYAQPAK
jgi:hypothetical protein